MADLEIGISNCRNIKSLASNLVIKEGQLNLFYAANGCGKTTTVEVLRYLGTKVTSGEEIKRLYSYDYIETRDKSLLPECTSSLEGLSVMRFNEQWISEHCFKESSLRDNAFQLFVETEDFRKTKIERDNLFGELRKAIIEDPEIEALTKAAADVRVNLGSTKKDQTLAATSSLEKAYKKGSPFANMPEALDQLTESMDLPDKAKWLKWHLQGAGLFGIEENICPYCSRVDSESIPSIKNFDKGHEGSEVSSWERAVSLFKEAPISFSSDAVSIIKKILPKTSAPSENDKEKFRKLICDTELAVKQISKLTNCINATSVLQSGEMKKAIEEAVTELPKTSVFSDVVNKRIRNIVRLLENLLKELGKIDSIDSEQRKNIEQAVAGHEAEFNSFLETAGYPYKVKIEEDGKEGTSLLLMPRKSSVPVDNSGLSYGEKNAITLVLFLYEVLYVKPDLVIFDDPISSFDGDKRHAILFGLFSDKQNLFRNNLHGFTTALFTHDFLIISDIRRIMWDHYDRGSVSMVHLHTNSKGLMISKNISGSAIQAYPKLMKERIKISKNKGNMFLAFVYARRYCELFCDDVLYRDSWDILSSLVHKRDSPTHKDKSPLKQEEIVSGTKMINDLVGNDFFDYDKLLTDIADPSKYLVELYEEEHTKDYEKLQVVRTLLMGNKDLSKNPIMNRYADESYHLGGDYLFQLNPISFCQVPYHVQEWCDKIVSDYKEKYKI